jgi:hypothetical protein
MQADDDVLVAAALALAASCVHCARCLYGLWTGSDRLLDHFEALPTAESVHRPGAWRNVAMAIALRGHGHDIDRELQWRPLVDFLVLAMRNEVDPSRLPTPPQVPAAFWTN